ncbi:hypothetical protein IGI04_038876 [Brassica rapa subsp. trilocularis]|uniref:Uncharacterized protein n=2 Tax=Brassica campestris TaxID=3711 RepID=M4ES55_BRACM|nr:uncharacterized protein LOC103843390 isoform X2 [Brassica rapa]KAG5387406.1 hypothetical protein IGI04_038876 [Brassica rapa subsp. trilocularis]
MAKYNEIAKKKREAKADRKRAIHGDPLTNKLKTRAPVVAVSGKRQKKLLRKWRREQKEMVEKGLVSMEDVEMASADAGSEDSKKPTRKFSVKKTIKLNKLKNKGNKKKSQKAGGKEVSTDQMLE